MTLPICTYGNPVLRQQAAPVGTIDDAVRDLVRDMLDTMYDEQGLGLAAEQVGRTERICVIDVPSENDTVGGERQNPDVEMPLTLIDPEILSYGEETVVAQEGCLSFPNVYADVERRFEVTFAWTDLDGERKTAVARGLLARAVQHELDHLDGILLVDRMSPVKKITLAGKLKRLVKQNKRNG